MSAISSSSESIPECSICLQPFCEGEVKVVAICQHIFHGPCSQSWILANPRSNHCPLCRREDLFQDGVAIEMGNVGNLNEGESSPPSFEPIPVEMDPPLEEVGLEEGVPNPVEGRPDPVVPEGSCLRIARAMANNSKKYPITNIALSILFLAGMASLIYGAATAADTSTSAKEAWIGGGLCGTAFAAVCFYVRNAPECQNDDDLD